MSDRPTWPSASTSPSQMSPLLGMTMLASWLYRATSRRSVRLTRPELSTSPRIPPEEATFARGIAAGASSTTSTGAMPAVTGKAGAT